MPRILLSIEMMRKFDSKLLSLWFADGTNYPGQDNLIARKNRMEKNLKKTHDMLDDDMQMLVEYKCFEPAFYATDIADWGMSYIFSKKCGPKAKVLVDLGHHALGGEEYEGIIGCDYWGAYRKFARLSDAVVQFCMAHL